jgi:hypothetical protein
MELLKLVWHLLLHIFYGTAIFFFFGVAAGFLQLFVSWIEQWGLIRPAVYGLRFVEYFIFILDGLAYLWFLIRVFWKFVREITRLTV